MAHFQFEATVNECLGKMDAPITRGPMMRWQRKELESRVSNGPLSPIQNTLKTSNKSGLNSSRKVCTPLPTTSKTPGKSPKKKSPKKTPTKTGNTPLFDRFIPNRALLDSERAHFQMVSCAEADDTDKAECNEYRKALGENASDAAADSRILHFKTNAPAPQEGFRNNLQVMYCQNRQSATKAKPTRHIPQTAEKILDAPDLLDDYYLNLLDWGADNQIAVVLGGSVYLWNAQTGVTEHLLHIDEPEFVSSVSWIKDGHILAVGNSQGHVQLWDVEASKCLRTMQGHAARVGALSWNVHLLTSGARSGAIHNHDVRVAEHHVGTLQNHTQEVCGLRWSPDGKLLASGGNDNVLNIWSLGGAGQGGEPLYSLTEHLAAVKALAWCPWQPSTLASGGGTADRNIRFWNTGTGVCLSSVDTQSQVCGLCWSREYREIISGHGFQRNQLTIWKYPSMTRVADLTGHSSRVLHMTQSPDGQYVASLAADETLRLWKCFETSAKRKPKSTQQKSLGDKRKGLSRLDTHIR